EIALHILFRMRQAVADARLGSEMDHAIKAVGGKACIDSGSIGQISADERPGTVCTAPRMTENLQPRLLECGVVIVVDDIDADNGIAALKQPLRDVEADESRSAGNEDFHLSTGPQAAFTRSQ